MGFPIAYTVVTRSFIYARKTKRVGIRVGTIKEREARGRYSTCPEVHCAHLKIIQFMGNSIGGGVSRGLSK
jgi:hypothetical protein